MRVGATASDRSQPRRMETSMVWPPMASQLRHGRSNCPMTRSIREKMSTTIEAPVSRSLTRAFSSGGGI